MNPLNVSKDPVSQLVARIIIESGLKDSEFVLTLGYTNFNNGLKMLHSVFREGYHGGAARFVQNIQDLYGYRDEFKQAFAEAARAAALEWEKAAPERERLARAEALGARAAALEWEKAAPERERLARANFRPYITVLTTDQRPSSIAIYAVAGSMFGNERCISLPASFLTLDDEDGLARVQDLVRQHYKKPPKPGYTCFFGAITGYVYEHHYGQSTRLDVDGVLLTGAIEVSEPGFSSLTIGNKTIVTNGLRIEIKSASGSDR